MRLEPGMEFFDAVIRFETALWTHAERALREAGNGSLADLEGLRAIAAGGEYVRVQEVSEALGVTIGAASKLVDRLARAGLAQRRSHPTDGRSSLLSLTPDGERRRAAGEAAVTSAIADRLAGADVDTAEVTRALRTLRKTLTDSTAVRL